jgi:hypothetical protein
MLNCQDEEVNQSRSSKNQTSVGFQVEEVGRRRKACTKNKKVVEELREIAQKL